MKNKLLCLILILAIVCSVFVISASAQDEYVIEAGTYRFIDTPNLTLSGTYPLPFYYSTEWEDNGVQNKLTYVCTSFCFPYENNPVYEIGAYVSEFYHYENGVLAGSLTEGNDIRFYPFYSSTLGFDTPDGLSPDLIVTTDTVVDVTFGTWFNENTERQDVIDTGVLSAGYYRLIFPIDIVEPTWIGDRNTVWYNMRGRVITDDSIRALSFHRLGFRYFVNEGADYGAGAWGLDLLVDTNTDTNLQVLTITFDRNSNQFYWDYNDLVLDSFVGFAIDGDYEVNGDFIVLFESLFEPYDYVYTGNPWYDIVDGVVDALKIDVFGDFSPWDILITFIGISVFIWLLKLLAGG